jgi:hypothetical protein
MISDKSETKKRFLKSYTQPGEPMSEGEFENMVRESEKSEYLTPDEFKKKC